MRSHRKAVEAIWEDLKTLGGLGPVIEKVNELTRNRIFSRWEGMLLEEVRFVSGSKSGPPDAVEVQKVLDNNTKLRAVLSAARAFRAACARFGWGSFSTGQPRQDLFDELDRYDGNPTRAEQAKLDDETIRVSIEKTLATPKGERVDTEDHVEQWGYCPKCMKMQRNRNATECESCGGPTEKQWVAKANKVEDFVGKKIGPFEIVKMGAAGDPWQMVLKCSCGHTFKTDPESGENATSAAAGLTWQPVCPECGKNVEKPEDQRKDCAACKGRGTVAAAQPGIGAGGTLGRIARTQCLSCGGTGKQREGGS